MRTGQKVATKLRCCLYWGCFLGSVQSATFAEAILELVPRGIDNPGIGVINEVTINPGATVTFDVILFNAGSVQAYEANVPVSAVSGTGGSGTFDFVCLDPGSPSIDAARPDFLFSPGQGHSAFSVTSCGPPPRLLSLALSTTADAGSEGAYLGDYTFVHSGGESGSDFLLAFLDCGQDPGTFLRDGNKALIPVECTGSIIHVRENAIPTVSEWGLVVMSVVFLTAGTLAIRRRARATAL